MSSAPCAPTGASPLLDVQGVSKHFGGVQALRDVHLSVARGSIHGLIGPNGAGKTTFFNVVTGLYAPDAGRFEFDGRPYRPHAIHEVVRIGIARTFQNIRLFGGMSVIENVAVARNAHTHSGLLGPILRTPAFLREERAVREHALELLDVVNLRAQAARAASTLSYGEQRRLEIARALATEPKLLALDEPAAGMNATEKLQLRELIESIRARGLTILLIEHDVKLVMGLCDQVTVLDQGRRIARGTPAEVSRDEAVIEAYLGASAAHARTAANAS
jgi:branched-chain amino acid transport system ATP-binding protein